MLNGTLDTFDLGDVLSLLEKGKKTGALEVESDDGRGVLFIVDGRFAGSGADEADPHPASADQFEAELVDACAALLGLTDGEFRFVDNRIPKEMPRELLDIGVVLESARRAAEEWRALVGTIPSLDAPVLIVPELPQAEITIDRQTWRVLALIDGSRSVRDLAHDLARSMATVGRTVADLVEIGVVAFFEAPADPVLIAGEPTGPARWSTAEPVGAHSPAPATNGWHPEPPSANGNGTGNGNGKGHHDDVAPAIADLFAPDVAPTPDHTLEPTPRAPRSVGELAAWADPPPAAPEMTESDPYAPRADGFAPAADDGEELVSTDSPELISDEGGEPTADLDVDATEPDRLGDDDHNDDMRRDRGALLRMFSALKE